ncbi:MAG: hypothetical protein QF615_08555, partial [Planctomycetota bacterium]|nr:hypothetical protein [Planctomycetota bacterium]
MHPRLSPEASGGACRFLSASQDELHAKRGGHHQIKDTEWGKPRNQNRESSGAYFKAGEAGQSGAFSHARLQDLLNGLL